MSDKTTKEADRLWSELIGVYSRTQKQGTVNTFSQDNQVITKEQHDILKLKKHMNGNGQ